MKTKEEAQRILERVVSNLVGAIDSNLNYSSDLLKSEKPSDTPEDAYLEAAQGGLEDSNLDEEFLQRAYREAIHVGEGPKNHSHINVTCIYIEVTKPHLVLLNFGLT